MSYTQLSSLGLQYPSLMGIIPVAVPFATSAASLVIDATGEKIAVSGRVWFPERSGSKSIRRVQIRFGNVTKAGGSALTLSLQDVSLTAGPAAQPDELQDQTVAIANADASFASNTWYRSGVLSADRSVSYGERLAVVLEFDGAGRLGVDSVVWAGLNLTSVMHQSGDLVANLKTGGTWGTGGTSAAPMLVIEFSDGTYGTLLGCVPYSALNTHTYNSGTVGADEYAMPFQVPVPLKIDALAVIFAASSTTSDHEVVLYEGNTPLATVSGDGNATVGNGAARIAEFPIAQRDLVPGTTYYIAVKPTTANNLSAYSVDVADAAFWALTGGDANATYSTRVDGGAWAAGTPTRRLLAAVRISAIDTPVYSRAAQMVGLG